ncbi:DUF3048 domain-containing protein [Streptomyces sp. 3MP-14]|uniref:DUF3048 domain-containing protein n=1 Tax=Streptomyces mimosae TaxID=2586635 RepID=A0A5N6A7A1_9ACTN|nr:MULTISPECIES: DUF3048 domain-containing protein [Streptomyces]KAB8163819.1 DUF3048 domain-containing protein [Streptomyces mimosae]KAB8175262.1 DUF3048 domain-containing protein [Streptomyces sp. 3MP-14]
MADRRSARAAAPALALALLGPLLLGGCEVERRENGADDAWGSPLTGLPGEPGPVLAVKVDNAPPARPHTGVEAADVVYVEEVEAGLSRLVAVFAGQLPDRVGPVRSARESDLELLRQFDEPALAFSGAQGGLLPLIDEAPLHARPPEAAPDAYARDPERAAPHNLYLDPAALLAATPEAGEVADIGFTFGDTPEGGSPVDEVEAGYAAASFAFRWDAAAERWAVAMDGEETELAAATVVVQRVEIRPSDFSDGGGAVSPYTETVGSGEATVLRDGREWPARWSRPSARAGTEFETEDGAAFPFAAGQVWVVYVPAE